MLADSLSSGLECVESGKASSRRYVISDSSFSQLCPSGSRALRRRATSHRLNITLAPFLARTRARKSDVNESVSHRRDGPDRRRFGFARTSAVSRIVRDRVFTIGRLTAGIGNIHGTFTARPRRNPPAISRGAVVLYPARDKVARKSLRCRERRDGTGLSSSSSSSCRRVFLGRTTVPRQGIMQIPDNCSSSDERKAERPR